MWPEPNITWKKANKKFFCFLSRQSPSNCWIMPFFVRFSAAWMELTISPRPIFKCWLSRSKSVALVWFGWKVHSQCQQVIVILIHILNFAVKLERILDCKLKFSAWAYLLK
jgi:hypothetical protein